MKHDERSSSFKRIGIGSDKLNSDIFARNINFDTNDMEYYQKTMPMISQYHMPMNQIYQKKNFFNSGNGYDIEFSEDEEEDDEEEDSSQHKSEESEKSKFIIFNN